MRTLVLLLALTIPALSQDVTPEVQQLYATARQTDNTVVAERNYRRILQLAPTLAPAYNNLGRILFDSNRDTEAADVLARGLALDPSMVPARIMLGATELRLGHPDRALPLLQAAHVAAPEDGFATLTLAEALAALDRAAEAIALLDPLLTANNTDQQAWYLSGKLHLQLSQSAFARVQSLGKDTPLSNIMAGEIMESMANTPGAIAAYTKAQAAEAPSSAGASQHLAALYWRTGDWPRAAAQYTAILAAHPTDCVARWRLADSHVEQGDAPEASLANLDTALEQCPALTQAHADRARLKLRADNPKAALADLLLAEQGAPDEPSVQQLLAQTYRLLGQREKEAAANTRFTMLQAQQHLSKEDNAALVKRANER